MNSDKKWVSGWGAATSYVAEALGSHIKDTTCRYRIIPTMSTSKVRLRFSNVYGEEAAELAAVSLGTEAEEYVLRQETITPVTFGGERSALLAAGLPELFSDEICFEVKAGEPFYVTIYFEKLTHLVTGHSNSGHYIKNCYARGNYVDKPAIDIESQVIGGSYLFLNTIDFLCDADCASIIAFGDSITALPWPDVVNKHLNTTTNSKRTVIRRAIGGNRILREYTAISRRRYGTAGISRFERDILSVKGANAVVVLHGINDIYHPRPGYVYSELDELPSVEELIDGYRYYIKIAHQNGLRIYFATLLPCSPLATHHESKIGMREALNEWIRTNDEADGFVEFESALIDKDAPEKMLREYDSGDHLHPNLKGEELMGEVAYQVLKDFGEI